MPVPESFQTARLEGVKLAPEHLVDLQALHQDPESMAELGGVRGRVETSRYLDRNLDHWDAHGFGVWMLRLKGEQRSIGRVVLRWLSTGRINDIEIGFALLPAHWGRGLATEASEFCLNLAKKNLNVRTLIGVTTPENKASQRVLSKLGLCHEGELVVEETQCLLYRTRW